MTDKGITTSINQEDDSVLKRFMNDPRTPDASKKLLEDVTGTVPIEQWREKQDEADLVSKNKAKEHQSTDITPKPSA